MIDDQGDEIFIEINPGEIQSFARFDSRGNKIILNLNENVSPGDYAFTVILSDGLL